MISVYHNACRALGLAIMSGVHSGEELRALVGMLGLSPLTAAETEIAVASTLSGAHGKPGHLVGLVLKAAPTADPRVVSEIVQRRLKEGE